jgi:hypothetical protein
VTRRVLEQNIDRAVTDKHCFFALPRTDALRRIRDALTEFDNLTVVAMVAVFERALRDHLSDHITKLLPATPDLLAALRERILDDAEYWNISSCVLDQLFKTAVPSDLCGEVKQIIEWRNQVAHGHVRGKRTPGYAVPSVVYQRLSDFLRASGLIPGS